MSAMAERVSVVSEPENIIYAQDLFGQSNPRVVVDGWRRRDPGDKARAYDSEDVVRRFMALGEQLSETELEKVARVDETEMLVASLAETIELDLFPYKLFSYGGRVGSLVEVTGDKGEPVWVFRDVVDMLENRVAKFPDDERSRAVMEGFGETVVPALLEMKRGETLVYLSPPADDGRVLEGEYGFVYFLTKVEDEKTGLDYFDSMSVKVGWESEEYFEVLDRLGVVVDKSAYPNDYWAVVNQAIKFDDELEQVAGEVLLGDERLEVGVHRWLEEQLELYGQAREFVEWRSEEFAQAVVGGVIGNLRRIVEELQLEWLESKQPEVYAEIQRQLFEYGYAELLVACGILEFGGGWGSVEMTMMGNGLASECVELKCKACGNTKIEEHHTQCSVCEWAPGKSVAEHQKKLRERQQQDNKESEQTTKAA